MQGTVPGLLSTDIEADIFEEALRSATISVNGRPAFQASYFKTSTTNYHLFMTLLASNGLVAGSNTVEITATDFANNTSTATRDFTFTPKSVPPPSLVDIVPVAVQVTQGIDTGPVYLNNPDLSAGRKLFFPGNSGKIRLVQGKTTLVRVYAAAARATSPVPYVPATMYVLKDNCPVDCYFNNGNALPPMKNANNPELSGITVPAVGTPNADPRNSIDNMINSWNFLIPEAWTTQHLVLFITLNDGSYYPLPNSPAAPECESDIVGECRDNNLLEIHLAFVPVAKVIVHPVLITLRGNFQGSPINVTPKDVDVINTLHYLDNLYPMHVELGTIKSLVRDPNIDDGDLLDDIQDKFGCGGGFGVGCIYSPREFILGLVPDNYPPNNPYGPLKDNAGLSNRGNGAFWSAASKQVTAAHEMGHAIGFMHASCVHTEADGGSCDAFFPIQHGGIGGYGFDFATWRMIPPGDTSSSTTLHAHDFMSYGHLCMNCNTERWVSTYMWDITTDDSFVDSVGYKICRDPSNPFPHFCGVDNNTTLSTNLIGSSTQGSLAPRLASNSQLGLLISGRINPDLTASLRPAYLMTITGNRAISSTSIDFYAMRGLDSKDNTVVVWNFVPREREDRTLTFTEVMPIPSGKTLARVELIHQGTILASLSGQPGGAPQVAITAPAPGDLWHRNEIRRVEWTAISGSNAPLYALIEYSPDGGLTSMALGRDVTENFLDVDVNELPASTNARIIVRVSDGLNSTTAMSQSFTVEPKPPTVVILQPANGITVTAHLPLSLVGMASDVHEELPDNALVWTSNRSGSLGTGRQLVVSELPPGPHTITLSATNRHGLTSEISVNIYVVEAAVFDVCLQDDRNGDTLRFNSLTGDYQFTHCGPGGFTMTGRGRISRDHYLTKLEDDARAVSAEFVGFPPGIWRGSATIKRLGVIQFMIKDSNILNNTCVCP